MEVFGPFVLLHPLAEPDVEFASRPGAEAHRARRVFAHDIGGPIRIDRTPSTPEQAARALHRLVRGAMRHQAVPQPGIVQVLEIGFVDGWVYQQSELADGADLGTLLQSYKAIGRHPPFPFAVAVVCALLDILQEVHATGHTLACLRTTDLLLTWDGRLRIRRFGLPDGPLAAGETFIAPECARGKAPDARADVWAAARILRCVLSGDAMGRGKARVPGNVAGDIKELLKAASSASRRHRPKLAEMRDELNSLMNRVGADHPAAQLLQVYDDLPQLRASAQQGDELEFSAIKNVMKDLPAIESGMTLYFPPSDRAARLPDTGDSVHRSADSTTSTQSLTVDVSALTVQRAPPPASQGSAAAAADGGGATEVGSRPSGLDEALESDAAASRSSSESELEDEGIELSADVAFRDLHGLDDDQDAWAPPPPAGEERKAPPDASVDPRASKKVIETVVMRAPDLGEDRTEAGGDPSEPDGFGAIALSEIARLEADDVDAPPPPREPARRARAADRETGELLGALDLHIDDDIRAMAARGPWPDPSNTELLTAGLKNAPSPIPGVDGDDALPFAAEAMGPPAATLDDADDEPRTEAIKPETFDAGATEMADEGKSQSESDERTEFLDASDLLNAGPRKQPDVRIFDADHTEAISVDELRELDNAGADAAHDDVPAAATEMFDAEQQPLAPPKDPTGLLFELPEDDGNVFAEESGPKPPAPRGPAVTSEDSIVEDPSSLGVLIIDAPDEATVFINGDEWGRGVVEIEGVDRFATFHVRVHSPGHAPWVGSISPDGRQVAKVTPKLIRR